MRFGVLQKMKSKIQRILVGLSLLVIIPGALLAIIILIAGIGSGLKNGFVASNLIAFPFLVIPSIMAWWGIKLVFRLYAPFSRRLRVETMIFHGLNLYYSGLLLASTATRDGSSFPIFGLQERIIGVCILSLPLMITLFTKDDNSQIISAEQAAPSNP